jgi:hypothetical protein
MGNSYKISVRKPEGGRSFCEPRPRRRNDGSYGDTALGCGLNSIVQNRIL